MKKYKVIAKQDLVLEGDVHTWTKGLDYEVIQGEDYIKLTTNQGHVNYVNKVKDKVLDNFELVKK